MGTLKNTSTKNAFGGGKEQLYTDDSGKTYRIRNSSLDNVYGDGKQKIIEESGSSDGGLLGMIFDALPSFIQIPIYIIIIAAVLYLGGWELISAIFTGFWKIVF